MTTLQLFGWILLGVFTLYLICVIGFIAWYIHEINKEDVNDSNGNMNL